MGKKVKWTKHKDRNTKKNEKGGFYKTRGSKSWSDIKEVPGQVIMAETALIKN